VVVGVGRVIDLERKSAHAPVLLQLDRSATVGDRLLDVREDSRAALVLRRSGEEDHEVIDGRKLGHS